MLMVHCDMGNVYLPFDNTLLITKAETNYNRHPHRLIADDENTSQTIDN